MNLAEKIAFLSSVKHVEKEISLFGKYGVAKQRVLPKTWNQLQRSPL